MAAADTTTVKGLPASAGLAPTETSPLLSESRLAQQSTGEIQGASNGSAENGHSADDDDGEDRGGNPEVAKRMHLLLPAVGIGIFLVAVDQLLTVAVYAKIGSELNALNNISWVATSYFLTLTSFQPLYGKLSDIFGRKECLLFAYAVFGIGSLGCGLARNMVELCVSRAVAGIGGGGMSAVVSILMSDIVPLRDRGLYQGYINIIYTAGTSTGAPLGGLLADSIGWRWSFLGQAPLCVVAWVVVYFVLDLPRKSESHWLVKVRQIDFLGAFSLVTAVVALLVGLDSGSNNGWSHNLTVVSLSLTPLLFALFLFIETKVAAHPFAPGHIIFDKGLFACYLANFFSVAGHFGIIFYSPLYFQVVHGLSSMVSGALLVPGTVSGVIASLSGGWLIRKTGRFYWLTVGGYGLLLLGLVPLVFSMWYNIIGLSVVGLVVTALGIGSAITTVLVALLANSKTEDSAVVIACSYLFRSLGSSIGVSISSAVLQQVLRSQLAQRLGGGDEARDVEEKVRQSIDFIKTLPPLVANQVRISYQLAVISTMVPTAIFLTCAFLVSFGIKERLIKK